MGENYVLPMPDSSVKIVTVLLMGYLGAICSLVGDIFSPQLSDGL
jgi:hypothetical protein